MTAGEIARQQAHYRKGVVLGLTVAETMLLLLFALLLALGYVLTNRARDMAALRHALDEAHASDQLLQAKVDVLERLVKNEPTDEFFRELVRARHDQAELEKKKAALAEREKLLAKDVTLRDALSGATDKQQEVRRLAAIGAKLEREVAKASSKPVRDGYDLIPAAVAAADAAREAGTPPDQAKAQFADTQKAARDAATLKGQIVRMRSELAKVGKGGEDPPCWVTQDGKIEYLLDVDLLGSGALLVRDATPASRLLDRQSLPLPPALFGRSLSPAEFLRLTLPVYQQGQAHQCRYFVFANDRTGSTQKVAFQNLLLTVEGHFYKNLRRSSARP